MKNDTKILLTAASIIGGAVWLLRKKQSTSGIGALSDYRHQAEYVNSPGDGANEYLISLWSGSGYGLSLFGVYADSDEEALDKVVAYCEKQGYDNLFVDDVSEEDEESGLYLYIDASMEGAYRTHYIYAENLGIEQIGRTNRNNTDYRSPYEICWIVLIPKIGIATKHDEQLLGGHPYYFRNIGKVALMSHQPSREAASRVIDWMLQNARLSKLDKRYDCYVMTDKQFGMIDAKKGWTKEAILDVLTTKQKDDVFAVGNCK